jgi:hypothetical protein
MSIDSHIGITRGSCDRIHDRCGWNTGNSNPSEMRGMESGDVRNGWNEWGRRERIDTVDTDSTQTPISSQAYCENLRGRIASIITQYQLHTLEYRGVYRAIVKPSKPLFRSTLATGRL